MEYKTTSREYLLRARSQLSLGEKQSLFYAAFELRCGIEARMREYLNVWNHISEKKKNGWRIVNLGQNIEKSFKSGDKVIQWIIHERNSKDIVACFYYTPVNKQLRKEGGKLGNYLHAMKEYKIHSNSFWKEFENTLEAVCGQLLVANTGTLLGPPLLNKKTNQIEMNLEIPPKDIDNRLFTSLLSTGTKSSVSVKHLNTFPTNLPQKSYIWDGKS